jgi:hypothetical protein
MQRGFGGWGCGGGVCGRGSLRILGVGRGVGGVSWSRGSGMSFFGGAGEGWGGVRSHAAGVRRFWDGESTVFVDWLQKSCR